MDMSNFRPELHVAQQNRRDKLRIQQEIYINNLDQFPAHDNGLACRPGNISYDPSEFCSEMINYRVNEPDKRAVEAFLGNFSRTNFNPSATMSTSDHPQCFSTWKSVNGSQSGCDSNWVSNDQGAVFVGESPLKFINKPYVGYQELQSPAFNNPSSENSSLYLQELVTSSNTRLFGPQSSSLRQRGTDETGNESWGVVPGSGGELLLLPAYADELKSASDYQWSNELNFSPIKSCNRDLGVVANDNSNTQALCLSLSSVPSPKVHSTQIAYRDTSAELHSKNVYSNSDIQENPENLLVGDKVLGNARQDLIQRNHGPLGPFTGYATILKSSKFLRPAQQLLDGHCNIARPKHVETCEVSDKMLENGRVSGDLSGSLFFFNSSNDKSRDPGGMSSMMDSYLPKNLQHKTKLLYMQDEVCKKYTQYHQQMQMVVSSFESVAGLSAATPYVSLALKMVSNNFRCLKNTIMDQLRSLRNALGEDLLAPTAGTSKDDASVSMLKFIDQSFQKQKGASNLSIIDSQHIWRPQRGLPERAVSILRAWLFDHFLHPYPTDTDKHMLATQTGLTRNQVSNWFINARVRVWKPMVEEIHMLETKGVTQTGSDVGKTTIDGYDHSKSSNTSSDKQVEISQSECCAIEKSNSSIWNQEKRSRTEYHIPTSVDGSLVGFVPSHRHGIEIGDLGAVSLTLGLRQSAESAAQRAPLQRFGGQIIRDYVG
ncbi:hypothetical protein BUALT_Bualt02G0042800 [Buddleja alternifolia]|uniref:Homeobox domain-containing protein n=1 Tax=Buddleja alternifolia TaxID=168488 RepID=A0AAV6XXW9_9LAMI|nr:hypothetical protein BUALT_Bualt02G0042800 [Buddleja alternifolia]